MELKEAYMKARIGDTVELKGVISFVKSDSFSYDSQKYSIELGNCMSEDWRVVPKPRVSAFQKWNCKTPVSWMDEIGERRRGWNAAIDEVVVMLPSGYVHPGKVTDKIKALKED